MSMRVIRHQSGWDIALDMVFTNKETAKTIAERIQHAVHALIRDAVDASMRRRTDAEHALRDTDAVAPSTLVAGPLPLNREEG